MSRGRVYLWTPDQSRQVGGSVTVVVVSLPRLDQSSGSSVRLRGRFGRVRNAAVINEPAAAGDGVQTKSLGDAEPDANGNFLFEPARGGGRVDKVPLAESNVRRRYVEASRFGEVNTYFHLDRIASYVDTLLQDLGQCSLPLATAVVNAHPAAVEVNGVRDGVRGRSGRWLPFQGGHYRLPNRSFTVAEHQPLSPHGEIHLGPGWRLHRHGALAEATGRPYRANAAHNAGIIYHEYGHHLARHTADFIGNAFRRADQQRNDKSAIEEGTCDYWVATMLDTPHIRAWNQGNDPQSPHWRCLVSAKTMAHFDSRPRADPHANGTIWGAALWQLRGELAAFDPEGVRGTDRLVLQALILLGRLQPPGENATIGGLRRIRSSFPAGLAALLNADELLNAGAHRDRISSVFAARGILPDPLVSRILGNHPSPAKGRAARQADLSKTVGREQP